MDAMEAILTRRSIRRYTKEPVTEEMMKTLLEAAMAAPSAHNEQPWRFIVIRERAILDEIPKYHQYSAMLKEAQAAIAVCGQPRSDMEKTFWVQDCSAATQNILIAAKALGLGAVWLGVYPREERIKNIQALLNMPEDVIPLSIISIGFPAEKKPPSGRYDAGKIHYEVW